MRPQNKVVLVADHSVHRHLLQLEEELEVTEELEDASPDSSLEAEFEAARLAKAIDAADATPASLSSLFEEEEVVEVDVTVKDETLLVRTCHVCTWATSCMSHLCNVAVLLYNLPLLCHEVE